MPNIIYEYCGICGHVEKAEVYPNSTKEATKLALKAKINAHKQKVHGVEPKEDSKDQE